MFSGSNSRGIPSGIGIGSGACCPNQAYGKGTPIRYIAGLSASKYVSACRTVPSYSNIFHANADGQLSYSGQTVAAHAITRRLITVGRRHRVIAAIAVPSTTPASKLTPAITNAGRIHFIKADGSIASSANTPQQTPVMRSDLCMPTANSHRTC